MEKDTGEPCVGFIDMDAFYVSVEENGPFKDDLEGKAVAVVQYNSNARETPDVDMHDRSRLGVRSGTAIAVNYAARAQGVKRNMAGKDAFEVCPSLVLVRVPTKYGKADLTIYKKAGNAVVRVLKTRAAACEKRSVDEVAIDITPEADRLLEQYGVAALLARARDEFGTHLADDAKSGVAAQVSKKDSRRGHAEQIDVNGQRGHEGDDEPGSSSNGSGSDYASSNSTSKSSSGSGSSGSSGTGGSCHGWAFVDRLSLTARRLVAGAVVVGELRASVTRELGYTCSGGIAINKLLSKLACGLHKPNQQTLVLPGPATSALLEGLPIDRLQGLGGDLGEKVKVALAAELKLESDGTTSEGIPTPPTVTCGMVAALSRTRLCQLFGEEKATYLYSMSRGQQEERVQARSEVKSLGASKNFFGGAALVTVGDAEQWLGKFSSELWERLTYHRDEYNYVPTLVTVSIGTKPAKGGEFNAPNVSRSAKLDVGKGGAAIKVSTAARSAFRKWCGTTLTDASALPQPVTTLGVSLGCMVALDVNTPGLANWMSSASSSTSRTPTSATPSLVLSSPSDNLDYQQPAEASTSSNNSLLFTAPKRTQGSLESPQKRPRTKIGLFAAPIEESAQKEAPAVDDTVVCADSQSPQKESSAWASALKQMREVGIRDDWSRFALKRCKGDLNAAMNYIFTNDMEALVANDDVTVKGDNNSNHSASVMRTESTDSESSPLPTNAASTFSGVAAYEIDSDVLAALPPEIAEEVRQQMALEERARRTDGAGTFTSSPSSSSPSKTKGKKSKERAPPGTQELKNFFQAKPVNK